MDQAAQFSIIVLTLDEEVHLERLLRSVERLDAPVFVLDSGSSDRTLGIAAEYGAVTAFNQFVNHPLQWAAALEMFDIQTPWIIGLDADHYLSPELERKLMDFRDADIKSAVNGIFFNRKNFFKGKWIRYGGYFPKYMLKMFRTGKVRSSLHERLDHRFIVEGETMIWKDGYLVEENLKENAISFWINKHNKYSDLVAQDELDKRENISSQQRGDLFGNPDQKVAAQKRFWLKMPLLLRPFLYFFYRYVLKFGFLDGRTGFIFHFLQAFWFRFLIDVKIIELQKQKEKI